MAALQMTGADRLDPVRFHFIEVLARRSRQQQGAVRRILDGRLMDALAACRGRFQQTQDAARETVERNRKRYPEAADDLQRLFVAGDFSGLSRFVVRLENGGGQASLGELTRYLAQESPEDGGLAEDVASRRELKSLRCFRNTWSKLSVDRQVKKAIEQAPEHAGPLNSHLLVLRSLALMRAVSPDYLNRFVSYVDTLLWLDQVDKTNRPAGKKPFTSKTARTSSSLALPPVSSGPMR